MLGRVVPHELTDEAAIELLRNCYSNLTPGGVIVFNTFDLRALEEGRQTDDDFTSADYIVTRSMESFVTDLDAGRWGFDAEYTITDRKTGETAVAEETMHLRAHTPGDLKSYFATGGFEDVSVYRESDFSLRAVASKSSR